MALFQLISRCAGGGCRRRRVFILCLGLVLLLSLGFVKHRNAEQRRVQAAIRHHLDAIRAAGQPVTLQELWAPNPNPPPERNWRLAVEPLLKVNSLRVTASRKELFKKTLSESVLLALTRDSASNAPLLEVVLRTDQANMEWCLPTPADLSSVGSRWIPPHYLFTRLCNILGEQAVYEAAAGHPDQAALALVRGFEAAHVLEDSLDWAREYTPVDGESISLQFLEKAMNCGLFAEADLLRLERALPRRATNLLHRVIVNDRVSAIWACELARDNPDAFLKVFGDRFARASETSLGQAWDSLQQRLAIYNDRDYLGLLDRFARLEQAAFLPLREQLTVFRRVDSERRAMDPDKASLAVNCFELEYAALVPLAAEDAENQTRLILARTALAVERWRLKHHGALPASLEELVPDYLPTQPLDPYDSQPVKLKPLPKGFTVYGSCQDSGVTNSPASTGKSVEFSIER